MAAKVLMTALSPTMEQGTVSRWIKKVGEKIASGEVICEIETDKATMDYEASEEGTLLKILVAEGQTAQVGEPIGIIGAPGEDISAIIRETASGQGPAAANGASRDDVTQPRPAVQVEAAAGGRVIASPLARKLAQQNNIDLAAVKGSGPGGRVIKRDIESYSPDTTQRAASQARPAVRPPEAIAMVQVTTKPLSGKRKVIAERLSASMFTAPHYYLTVAVEVDRLLAARARINAGMKSTLGLNAFLLKFVAAALKKHPVVNGGMGEGEIHTYTRIDLGLAVALEDGLITPVVRDCAQKGVVEIDGELKDLIKRSNEGKLAPDEYTGATFTISNLGSFGIEQFTAIINPPGAAILAVGAAIKEPVVVDDDKIVVRTRMKLTLSCDHRVIDGAVGAAFLKTLKDLIEEPIGTLL